MREDEEIQHPGKLLDALLKAENYNKWSMASWLGISKFELDLLIQGDLELNEDMAKALYVYTGIPEEEWNKIEKAYRASLD